MFRCLTSLLGLTTKISLETMATIAVANAPCCAEPVDDDSSKPPENVGTRAVPTWATKSVPGHPYFTATGASPREGSARLNQHAPATAAEMISSQTQPLEKEIDFLSQLDPQVRAFMRWLSLHPSLQTTGYYAPTWNHLDPEQRLMVLGCALMAGFSIRKSGVVKGVSDCLYCQ
ncbi:MAG TPA: hypothetical protein VJC18_09390, partial [bacterium]|nr:hypothetical protein [bacterium]